MSNFADVIRQRNEEIDKRGRNPLDVIVKIHMRIFLFSLVNVWVCQFLGLSICTGPPDLMENDTDLKLGTHPLLDLIQKCFFFVFLKKWPWGPLASKNYRVTWIFRISPRFPNARYCPFFDKKVYSMQVGVLNFRSSFLVQYWTPWRSIIIHKHK